MIIAGKLENGLLSIFIRSKYDIRPNVAKANNKQYIICINGNLFDPPLYFHSRLFADCPIFL